VTGVTQVVCENTRTEAGRQFQPGIVRACGGSSDFRTGIRGSAWGWRKQQSRERDGDNDRQTVGIVSISHGSRP